MDHFLVYLNTLVYNSESSSSVTLLAVFKDKGDWTSLGPLCVPVLESFLTRFIYILKATKQIIKTILKNSFFRKRDPTSTKYL